MVIPLFSNLTHFYCKFWKCFIGNSSYDIQQNIFKIIILPLAKKIVQKFPDALYIYIYYYRNGGYSLKYKKKKNK